MQPYLHGLIYPSCMATPALFSSPVADFIPSFLPAAEERPISAVAAVFLFHFSLFSYPVVVCGFILSLTASPSHTTTAPHGPQPLFPPSCNQLVPAPSSRSFVLTACPHKIHSLPTLFFSLASPSSIFKSLLSDFCWKILSSLDFKLFVSPSTLDFGDQRSCLVSHPTDRSALGLALLAPLNRTRLVKYHPPKLPFTLTQGGKYSRPFQSA